MTSTLEDRYYLQRFVAAQAGAYVAALDELRAGRKRGHWMWFVFPQVAGLGSSPMAERYAIGSRAEAGAYLDDPLLGLRLRECAEALLGVREHSAREVMGTPDDLKLKSSMTLFAAVSAADSVFHRVLEQYYGGERDERTLEFLEQHP